MRVDAGGVGIEYEVTGEGRPVVLLHGFPDSGRLWRHQVPALAEAGFRVIVPDLRGYGRSDKPREVDAYAMQAPWWRDSIIDLRSGETFTRSDFVLGIAHREGGAHVDPDPPVQWVLLRDQGWDDAGGTVDAGGQLVPFRDLVPAVVRQIGYEVSETLAKQRATLAH